MDKYARCAHIQKDSMNYRMDITEDQLLDMNDDPNVLPLFENRLNDIHFKKKYSFTTNKQLKCRWQEYVNQTHAEKKPINLPKNDIHFKNHKTVYDPFVASTLVKRKHMVSGPGFDMYGELPIPNDSHIRQTTTTTSRKSKNIQKKIK